MVKENLKDDEKEIKSVDSKVDSENGTKISDDQQGDKLDKTNEQVPPVEKKKRGRPKKNKETDKPIAEPKKEEPKKDEIKDLFAEFNEIPPEVEETEKPAQEENKPKKRRGRPKGSGTKKTQVEENEIKLSGEMLLTGINFAMPVLIKSVYGLLDSRAKKIESSALKLDKHEKAELQDSADAVAKELFGNANPMYVFFAGLLFVFGEKVSDELSKIPKQ